MLMPKTKVMTPPLSVWGVLHPDGFLACYATRKEAREEAIISKGKVYRYERDYRKR